MKPILKYFFIILIIKIIAVILVYLHTYFWDNSLLQLLKSNADEYTDSVTINFVLIVLTAPILEELSFRMALSKRQISIRIGLNFFIMVVVIVMFDGLIKSFQSLWFYLIVFLISVSFNLLFNKFKIEILKAFRENLSLIEILSVILFSVFHLIGYSLNTLLNLEVIGLFIYLIPYLFMAYYLSKLRMKEGIVSSIVVHGLHNMITFSGLVI